MLKGAALRLRSAAGIILFSPDERRLRAGWRLGLQVLLQGIFTLASACGLMALIPGGLAGIANLTSSEGLAQSEIAQVAVVTLSVFLARRLLDRRSFVSLGLLVNMDAARDLGTGLGITFLVMVFIYLTQWALGWLHLDGLAWQFERPLTIAINSLLYLGIFLLVGWSEELMSRGYHLQTIASGTNLLWGVFLSSAIFGALHLGNPHATSIGAIGIFFAGLFLAYAFVRTGQLWMSIGLHIGWNFFEGVVFGFPVSGLTVFHLARVTVSGPELWTGGAFGPEAGIIVLPAIAVGFCFIHLCTRSRSHE